MAIPLGDSHYGEWRDRLELETTERQDRAAVFLEGQGYIFLVDFGYGNAVEKAQLARKGLLPAPYGSKGYEHRS